MFNLLVTSLIFENEKPNVEVEMVNENDLDEELTLIEEELGEAQEHIVGLYERIEKLEEKIEKYLD